MVTLPEPVNNYLQSLSVRDRYPAFLLSDAEGNLLDSGGSLAHYGFAGLVVGDPVGDQILFLAGMLPLVDDEPGVMECLQVEDGPPIDVHLFRGFEGDWAILLDASETEQRQREMQQRGNELSLRYQELVKETQKKEILLHCIVHDLAGPLMGIRGGFELLATEKLSDEGRQLLELGQRQATRQEALIRDILQAFAAEVEQSQSFSSDFESAPDARSTAREAIKLLKPAFDLNHVSLELDVDSSPQSNWKVIGESSRLERVFSNLIENALRHSPAASTVVVRLIDEGEQVLAAIDDQGPGVPPEAAGTLFQKFAQAKGKGKGKAGKIGLGLYFCRITVERWGGTIGHEPGPKGGSRFWFRLPRPAKTPSQPSTR
jgi:signal transduction histidine kinase